MIIIDTIHDPDVVHRMSGVFLAFKHHVQPRMNGQPSERYTGYPELNRGKLAVLESAWPGRVTFGQFGRTAVSLVNKYWKKHEPPATSQSMMDHIDARHLADMRRLCR